MSPVTHLLTGWVLATAAGLDRRERAVVAMAAVVPDLDGLGAIPELLTRHSEHPLLWFSQYHHGLHTLLFALVVAVAAYWLTGWAAAGGAFLGFHLHLLEDVLGSRGPDGYGWPIPYLSPFGERWSWAWAGQWALNAWPNVAITGALCCLTVWIAVRRGCTPAELVSAGADRAVVRALRERLGGVKG